jgi:hypothetical protein
MQLYDANHDGFLDAKELEKVPGLKAAMTQVDTNHDGKITEQEIAERIKSWADSRAGRVPVRLTVTHGGKPLAGAQVVLAPETFLGSAMQSGSGTTSELGIVSVASSCAENAKVHGLAPGFYRVEITKRGDAIPARYNTATTLGAEASIDDQRASLTYDLKY